MVNNEQNARTSNKENGICELNNNLIVCRRVVEKGKKKFVLFTYVIVEYALIQFVCYRLNGQFDTVCDVEQLANQSIK